MDSNSPPPVNSLSPMSSLSKALDATQLVPNPDVVYVEDSSSGDPLSPAAATAQAVYDAVFDDDDDVQEVPGPSSSVKTLNDYSLAPLPLSLCSNECRSFNSPRVSGVPPPPPPPPQALAADFLWLFSKKKDPRSKDKASDCAVIPSTIGAGLENLGNTCFLNSILQCFTHTVPFVQRILSCSHDVSRDGHDGFCVICAFRDQIGFALTSSGKSISPWTLVNNLDYFCSDFMRHQQEDAHEFMQCALDKLERCYLDLKKKNMSFEDDNIVEKVFGGRLISTLECCNCGRSSDTYEPLIDLSLEIENIDSLSSALESFTMVESIDAKFRCDGCKEEVSMEKQLMLDQAPSVATFHLKRFKTDGFLVEKIDKHIDFPLELDLQPYTISNENENVSLKYDLYAVVVHMGSTATSGHYFCFVRTAPDTWHNLDDPKVTEVSGQTVLSQEAYLLFYARQGTPWFSSIKESLVPFLDPWTTNTSPKSVLDIGDGLNKSEPILITNTERSEVAKSKKDSEQQFDFSCQETHGFLEVDDILGASTGCGQLPAELNPETANMNCSDDINAQVQSTNKTILTDISSALFDGNSSIENSAIVENKGSPEVFDFRENDVFHPLTPPRSPSPDKCFKISRDHLKNQGSSKRSSKKSVERSSNKSMGDPNSQAAMRYLKTHGSRRSQLMDFIGCSPENKRKVDSLQSNKDNSARKKPNHAVAAGVSVNSRRL